MRSVQMTYAPRLCVFLCLLACVAFPTGASGADAAAPVAPPPKEWAAALKSLKDTDAAGRQKIYDQLAVTGDARLIPALKAYRDGSLLLRGEQLAIFGERVSIPEKGSVLPMVDALTGAPVIGDDKQPIYVARIELSLAIKSPPRIEKGAINELIASLSLLDPDPVVRIASIRDAGERAARAFPDPSDTANFMEALTACSNGLAKRIASPPSGIDVAPLKEAVAAIAAAQADHPTTLVAPAPGDPNTTKIQVALLAAQMAVDPAKDSQTAQIISDGLAAVSTYQGRLDMRKKVLDDLPKTDTALKRQLTSDPKGRFAPALKEAVASLDLVVGDRPSQLAAAVALGKIGTSRAANILHKAVDATERCGDTELHAAVQQALKAADRYQTEVHFIQNTFAGLSLGSILVLMALGLSIIFGLMGVINMAQGEFMMVGAFTTYLVSQGFRHLSPGAYEYYLLAAIPAAFLVSATVGYLCEALVIRHLYGRPLETLLATWGIGLVLVQAARALFGDTLSVAPPKWMEGGVEFAPDLVFPLNRLCIIAFCAVCIIAVNLLVNRTKLGLLLRATTQNREMANALGVPTRRVDGLTFALGAGLAGLAGVVVPLYNKINPNIGQEYIVDTFMVVVVGGVGKLAGAVWAGLGLGFLSKYIEPVLQAVPALSSGASVLGKVLVLGLIIVFLQWRPSGLFPPKGRNVDA